MVTPEGSEPRQPPSIAIATTRVEFGKLLRRSAAIPCLSILEGEPRTQREIVERLRGYFAPNTVIDSLEVLVSEGLASRRRALGATRSVEYFCTARGQFVANLPLKALMDHIASLPEVRPARDRREVLLRLDDP